MMRMYVFAFTMIPYKISNQNENERPLVS